MPSGNFFTMIGFSLLGCFITIFAFAASSSGQFRLNTLTLPGVIQTASLYAVVCGILLWPLMYWCLKGKNLLIILPIIYVLAFLVTVLLTILDPKVGFIGAFAYWVLILVIIKYFVPESP